MQIMSVLNFYHSIVRHFSPKGVIMNQFRGFSARVKMDLLGLNLTCTLSTKWCVCEYGDCWSRFIIFIKRCYYAHISVVAVAVIAELADSGFSRQPKTKNLSRQPDRTPIVLTGRTSDILTNSIFDRSELSVG